MKSGATWVTMLLAADLATAVTWDPVPAQPVVRRAGLGNVLAKLEAGRPVTIAYFGGSITAANGWRPKTFAWFKETWPQVQFTEFNAAIGGTPSALGAYRMQRDVLRHQPDLIFVEFAVNDTGGRGDDVARAMEGIVRQAWRQDPTIDLCFVYTFRTGFEQDLDQGNCPQAASVHEKLAEHYQIPSINMAIRVAAMHRDGQLLFVPEKGPDGRNLPAAPGVTLFTDGDGVHPNDAGHTLYTEDITAALKSFQAGSSAGPHELKPPLMADNWERAQLLPLEPRMFSEGWTKLDPETGLGKQFGLRMPDVWEARTPGASLSFKFRGSAVQLYDLLGPDAGQVMITLDGQTRGPVPRFDKYCSYHRLATLGIGNGLADGVHEVKVEIHPDQPDRRSVTDVESQKPGFNPAKYEGTNIRVGAILVIGELVP